MRKSRAALVATVLTAAAALALGVALPSLADTENHRIAALDGPEPSASGSTPPAPQIRTSISQTAWPRPTLDGVSFTMEGRITAEGSNDLPAGTELTVKRTDMETPSGKTLGTVKSGAAGFFSLADTPPFGGEVSYTFAYAGSAQFAASAETMRFDIPRRKPTLTMDKSPGHLADGMSATFTARLGKTYKNRVLEIWVQPYVGPERLVKRATVDSAGRLAATVKFTYNAWVVARFAGDAQYAPDEFIWIVKVKARVNTALTGHYTTKKVGSLTYQFFRKSKNPVVTHSMTPYQGRTARTRIEVYRGGKWQLWSGRDTKLTTTGKATFTFVTGAKVGVKYRIRAEYKSSIPRDFVNDDSLGTWKYFTYTK